MKKRNVVGVTKENKPTSGLSHRSKSMAVNLQKMGMKRRKKEVRHVKVMAGLSVIFLALTLLFSENMKSYQLEINFHNYGEWFMRQPEGMIDISHPYLKEAGKISTGSEIYHAEDGKEEKQIIEVDPAENDFATSFLLGTMNQKAAEMGNICLYDGRLPEAEDEIAVERNVLQALGYDYEIGKEISFYIAGEGNLVDKILNDEKLELHRVTFRLVGTIKNYTYQWIGGDDLPSAIVSSSAYEKLVMPKKSFLFYQIREEYQEVDAQELSSAIIDSVTNSLGESGANASLEEMGYYYNSFVYENIFWDNQTMYRNMTILLMVLGAASLAYLMSVYLSRRRAYYFKLRGIGATAMQIRKMALYECVMGTVPSACVALLLSYLGSVAIVWCVARIADIPFFYVFHWGTLGRIAGCFLLVLVVSMTVAVTLLGARRIEEKRKEISPRCLKRIGRRAARRKRRISSKEMLCRERQQHPYSTLFVRIMGIAACIVILCCMMQIYQSMVSYKMIRRWCRDYSISDKGYMYSYRFDEEEMRKEAGMEDCLGGGTTVSDMANTIPESLLTSLQELSGIQKIDCSTKDQMRIFDWDGKEHSTFYKAWLSGECGATESFLQKEENRKIIEEKIYPKMYEGYYYKDFKPIWKDLKKHLDLNMADYEKISQGKQVILFVNDDIYASDNEEIRIKENTLKVGDTLRICTKGNPVSVEIGGILGEEFDDYLHGAAYTIYGSEVLGQAIAKEDGISYGYNRINVDFNVLAPEETTGRMIARLCALNYVDYNSDSEQIRFGFQKIIQSILIYGTLAGIIFVMYLFISFCIVREKKRKQSPKMRCLHQFGMSLKQIQRMHWRNGLQEGIILWLSIPVFYLVQAKKFSMDDDITAVVSMYSVVLGKSVKCTGETDYILFCLFDRVNIWWCFLFLLLATGIMMLLYKMKGEQNE